MIKKLKKIVIIIGIIIFIIITVTIINYSRAYIVAKNHLSEKYSFDIKFVDIRFSWIDPSLYHVYFSPKDNSDLIFSIMVHQNFTISDWTNEYGYFSADNYYTAYFEYRMKEFYLNDVKDLFGEKINLIIRVPNHALYAFTTPEELNDTMSLNEMDSLIDEYLIIIDTKRKIDEDVKFNEANKILEFIHTVQKSGYNPKRIVFWYNTKNRGSASVSYDDWQEINSIEQILLNVNEEFLSTNNISKSDEAYYRQYFAEELAKKFKEDADKIWNNSINITAELRNAKSINDYKIYDLTKDINIDDIEHKLRSSYYSYSLEFTLPIEYNKRNGSQQREEAEKIYELTKIIQESGYEPHKITFTYFYPDSYKQQYIIFWAYYVSWTNVRWTTIDSIESVIERLNEDWYDK
jgi:hypothetical protein